MKTINYKRKIVLKVKHADNYIRVSLNPDRNRRGALVHSADYPCSARLNDKINMTPIAENLGKECVCSVIGANFEGGGRFSFKIKADGKDAFKVNENLPQWKGKMWTVKIVKT